MKILMVLTSHDELGNTGRKTGFWLEEFAAPYFTFLDAGASVTVASPKGGQPPLDPVSDTPEGQTELTRRFKQDPAAQAVLANTLRLSDVKASDYDAIFYPGGHGPTSRTSAWPSCVPTSRLSQSWRRCVRFPSSRRLPFRTARTVRSYRPTRGLAQRRGADRRRDLPGRVRREVKPAAKGPNALISPRGTLEREDAKGDTGDCHHDRGVEQERDRKTLDTRSPGRRAPR
jgi:hypothetical protein